MAHNIVCYKHNRILQVLSHTDLTKEDATIKVGECSRCLEEYIENGYNRGWKAAGIAISKGPPE